MKTDTKTQALALLRQAVRYIEVCNAYKGAMTEAEVEAAILANRNTTRLEIGCSSVSVLARFNLAQARELLDKEGLLRDGV